MAFFSSGIMLGKLKKSVARSLSASARLPSDSFFFAMIQPANGDMYLARLIASSTSSLSPIL